MLSIRLLGPLEASLDGEPVDLGGARPRVLLALLATARGRVVQRERLIDALWEDAPPESARGQIAIHISALRKALGAEVIETVGAGYRLRPDLVDVDVVEVERLAANHADDGDDRAQHLRSALGMWRGPVLAGLPSAVLAPEAQRLEELRLNLVEEWADLALDRGDHRPALELLGGEVADHPLREPLRLRLMQALWASGRRADALGTYREGQEVLAAELGLDPGAELQDLHQRILREEHPAPAPRRGPAWSSPHRLPIPPARFVGRAAQLADLDRLLSAEDLAGSRAGQLIALHGIGGVGKTTLALRWAHRVAADFPDGQLFVNLRGHGRTDSLSVGNALEALLRAIGLEPSHIPDEEEARSALLRERLDRRRLLIVLDNARDSAQVRPLLPGGRHTVLVTSRSQLRSLVAHDGARRIRVDPMVPGEAVELLTDRLRDNPAFDDTRHRRALAELASVCGRLPIALAVAAERAGRYDGLLPLAALTAELRGDVTGTTPLDALTTGHDDPVTDVRAVLSWSYAALNADAARQFRLLGLHPHPTYDAHAAAWLAGQDLATTKRLLDRLVDANLLTETTPGQYEMHDLVRAFAVEVAHADERAEERTQAVARMRAGYAHSAANARTVFLRAHQWLDGGPLPTGVAPREFTDANAALSWARDGRSRLMDLLGDAAGDGDHDFVKRLVAHADAIIQVSCSVPDHLAWIRVALDSALAAGDPEGEVLARSVLGMVRLSEGRAPEAIAETTRAVEVSRPLDHPAPLEVALLKHGLVLDNIGRHAEAVTAYLEGAELAQRRGGNAAAFHNNLAHTHLALHHHKDARRAAVRAIEEARAEGANSYHLAQLIDTLGAVKLVSDDPEDAAELFQQAVDLLRDGGTSDGTAAHVLRNLGLAQRELGRFDDARASWESALEIVGVTEYAFPDAISQPELHELIASLSDATAES